MAKKDENKQAQAEGPAQPKTTAAEGVKPADPDGKNYELRDVEDSPIVGHQEQVHKDQ